MSEEKTFRQVADDIDGVLERYGKRAQVVQLWWRNDPWTPWVYTGRLRLDDYRPFSDFLFVELIQSRYGGGWFRARIYGPWDRKLRREPYLAQVSFGIGGPPAQETLSWVRRAKGRR